MPTVMTPTKDGVFEGGHRLGGPEETAETPRYGLNGHG